MSMNSIDRLPTELLLFIVKQLSKRDLYTCTLTSKRFYTAANPLLWRSIYLCTTSNLANVIHAESPYSLSLHIRTATFHSEELILSDKTLLAFIKLVPRLEILSINLQHNYTTNASLQQIGHYCPKLENLDLSHCFIARNTILVLGQQCQQLRALTLECNTSLGTDIVTAIATCQLESLVLKGSSAPFGLKSNRNNNVNAVTSNKTVLDLAGLQRLKRLWIGLTPARFDASSCMATTYDRHGNVIWPLLNELILWNCTRIDDPLFLQFIQLHPRLVSLHIACLLLTDDSLDAIVRLLPNIKSLSLCGNHHFTHGAVHRLVMYCPRLFLLQLHGSPLLLKDFPEHAQDFCRIHSNGYHGGKYVTKLGRLALDAIRRGDCKGTSTPLLLATTTITTTATVTTATVTTATVTTATVTTATVTTATVTSITTTTTATTNNNNIDININVDINHNNQ